MGLFCLLTPSVCATSIAKSTFGDLFNAVTSWIVASVQWLLDAAARVLTTSSGPAAVLAGAKGEFASLIVVAPVLMVIGLLVATLAALRHGDSAAMWRAYLAVAPACVAAVVFAPAIAGLVMNAVDELSHVAAANVSTHVAALAATLTGLAPTTPGFGLFLLAVAVVIGTWLLWCELVVRTVLLTVLLVLVPVVVPLATFPALRRVGWRLFETFVAVAASKFVIVVVLALGLNELTGRGRDEVIVGAVTLLLATASPYLLLRFVPLLEQSALHNVEGLRRRATNALAGSSHSPLARGARALRPEPVPPEPPARRADLGLETWPGSPPAPMPPMEGETPAPPIGRPRRRGGHVVYGHDDGGPVVGWHFDE